MNDWITDRAAAAERETGTTFDLSACVREPIHRLGGIQSYGALIALDDDGNIVVSSSNAPADLVVDKTQLSTLRQLADADTGQTATMPVVLADGRRYDVTVHRSDGLLVLEFEPSTDAPGEFAAFYGPVRQALMRLQRAATVDEACAAAVREIRAITGYDRVVAYRFETVDGPGEVIAEEVIDEWEPWLGLWFPATDIPPQARRLYERNWIRVIADVDDTTARLEPAVLPSTGEPLDLSLSVLRTVSDFHLEYLRNIEVTSSMSVSLLSGGRLWGLIACHGQGVKALSPQVRAACEFFGVALSLHLAALRERDETAARERSRETIARLLERISADLPTGWASGPAGLEKVVDCDAVAIRMDGRVVVHGPMSADAFFEALPPLPAGSLWHSDRLAEDLGISSSSSSDVAGALVLPLSGSGDCIAWLRGERTVSRRWAADPRTPVLLGPRGRRLTPRGSTAVFLASVRGRATPWSPNDLAMAVELGRSIMEIAVAHTRELSALNAELDSFAHAAAHDLKEPLRGIANTATFIAEDAADGLDPVTARRLESIQRLATRMDELLNALLYYARLGRTDLQRETVSLRAATLRALEVAGPRLEAAAVAVTLPPPSAEVTADPVLFEEVLVNLLVNAAKYVRTEGERTVSVGLTDTPAGPAVFVRDNGIGMPPHLREQAFQLFRRLHPSPAAQDGSGAGLAIVRRVVERHGGQAWAEDTPGGGTTMFTTFPSLP